MKNLQTIESTEKDKQISDNALIAKLRYELEECQASNRKLQKTNLWQEQRIESQSKLIDSSIDVGLLATKKLAVAINKIKRLESEIENQNRTVIFLNDWKFADHRFLTNLKATCDN